MKTNFILALVSFSIGAGLMWIISQPNSTENAQAYNSPSPTKLDISETNKVPLEEAQNGIWWYDRWVNHQPDSVTFDTLESEIRLKYDDVSIHKEADTTLYNKMLTYIREYYETNESGNKVAMHGQKNRSYYIRKQDIMEAFDAVSSEEGEEANGIRVYLAVENLLSFGTNSLTTHLFVVPTYLSDSVNKDFIPSGENGQFVYDLTTPCPATCGGVSEELNNPSYNESAQ